jgi:hypothetical protein
LQIAGEFDTPMSATNLSTCSLINLEWRLGDHHSVDPFGRLTEDAGPDCCFKLTVETPLFSCRPSDYPE